MMENISITFDEALETLELAHFHEAIHFLNNKPVGSLFPAKYEAAIQLIATKKTVELFENNPKTPLNKVISRVMDNLPTNLSPQLLLEMTQAAIEKWKQLTYEVATPKGEAVLV